MEKVSVSRPAVNNRISKCEVLKHFYAGSRKIPGVFGVKSVQVLSVRWLSETKVRDGVSLPVAGKFPGYSE